MDYPNQSQVSAGNQMPVAPSDGPGGPQPEESKSSVGPIAGAVIVILLLIAGGLYFWGAKMNEQAEGTVPFIPSDDVSTQEETVQVEGDTSVGLPPQSSSDDVSSIEADMNAMDLDEMNAENSAELNNL